MTVFSGSGFTYGNAGAVNNPGRGEAVTGINYNVDVGLYCNPTVSQLVRSSKLSEHTAGSAGGSAQTGGASQYNYKSAVF